jgi:membrane protease YdiL (CAAX protease family)
LRYDAGMIFSDIAADLGLNRSFALLRDGVWWAVLLAGMVVPVVLWRIPGVDAASSVPHGLAAWLAVIVWQPALEELLFRGLLQGVLLEKTWGNKILVHISIANLVTSTLFVAMHFVHHSPLWAMAVFPPSLIFGWFRERHANVWSPLILHGMFNLAFFASAGFAAT